MALQATVLPPPPRGFGVGAAEVVVDEAGVLGAESVARINRLASDVHDKSGGEIAVAVLRDLGNGDPSETALRIGRAWGVGKLGAIGDRAKNAGVVILVVPRESSADGRGKCWVSSGRGSEGFILDADAAALCRDAIAFFRTRD